MITAAEQYRALVAKLEAINPSETIQEDPATDASSLRTAQDNAGSQTGTSEPTQTDQLTQPMVDRTASGSVDPDKYKPNDNIPVIKAGTLVQAKQIALKQLGPGKKFRFCMTYGTKLGPARPTTVTPMPRPPDNFSQLGGANVVKPAPTYSGITDKLPSKGQLPVRGQQ
jgi:hypothetical protein